MPLRMNMQSGRKYKSKLDVWENQRSGSLVAPLIFCYPLTKYFRFNRAKERLSKVSQAITERQASRRRSEGSFHPWKSWTARSRHSVRTTGTALWSTQRYTAGRTSASPLRMGWRYKHEGTYPRIRKENRLRGILCG